MDLLIVDGNKKVRDLVRSITTAMFDTIYECEDGLNVEHNYSLYSPDFVLMDITTKKINGLVLTKRLKMIHPNAKIILMSNSTDDELKELAIRSGAFKYILKEDLHRIPELFAQYRIKL